MFKHKIGDSVYFLDLLGKFQVRHGVINDIREPGTAAVSFAQCEGAESYTNIDLCLVWRTREQAIFEACGVIKQKAETEIKNLRKFMNDDIKRIKAYRG